MCFSCDCTYEFFEQQVNRAKKQHVCECCRRTIEAGEHYQNGRGVADGQFWTWKVCRRCMYDIARIVAHELDSGCHWSESWPPHDEVGNWFADEGLERTPLHAVPDSFDPKDDQSLDKTIKSLRKAAA